MDRREDKTKRLLLSLDKNVLSKNKDYHYLLPTAINFATSMYNLIQNMALTHEVFGHNHDKLQSSGVSRAAGASRYRDAAEKFLKNDVSQLIMREATGTIARDDKDFLFLGASSTNRGGLLSYRDMVSELSVGHYQPTTLQFGVMNSGSEIRMSLMMLLLNAAQNGNGDRPPDGRSSLIKTVISMSRTFVGPLIDGTFNGKGKDKDDIVSRGDFALQEANDMYFALLAGNAVKNFFLSQECIHQLEEIHALGSRYNEYMTSVHMLFVEMEVKCVQFLQTLLLVYNLSEPGTVSSGTFFTIKKKTEELGIEGVATVLGLPSENEMIRTLMARKDFIFTISNYPFPVIWNTRDINRFKEDLNEKEDDDVQATLSRIDSVFEKSPFFSSSLPNLHKGSINLYREFNVCLNDTYDMVVIIQNEELIYQRAKTLTIYSQHAFIAEVKKYLDEGMSRVEAAQGLLLLREPRLTREVIHSEFNEKPGNRSSHIIAFLKEMQVNFKNIIYLKAKVLQSKDEDDKEDINKRIAELEKSNALILFNLFTIGIYVTGIPTIDLNSLLTFLSKYKETKNKPGQFGILSFNATYHQERNTGVMANDTLTKRAAVITRVFSFFTALPYDFEEEERHAETTTAVSEILSPVEGPSASSGAAEEMGSFGPGSSSSFQPEYSFGQDTVSSSSEAIEEKFVPKEMEPGTQNSNKFRSILNVAKVAHSLHAVPTVSGTNLTQGMSERKKRQGELLENIPEYRVVHNLPFKRQLPPPNPGSTKGLAKRSRSIGGGTYKLRKHSKSLRHKQRLAIRRTRNRRVNPKSKTTPKRM